MVDPGFDVHDSEVKDGVRLPRERVAMVLDFYLVFALVDDRVVGDVTAIGADVRNVGAGVVPPEPVVPVEFFLGDELRETMCQTVFSPGGELAGRSASDRRDEQFAVAHVGDALAIGAQLRVDRPSDPSHLTKLIVARAHQQLPSGGHEQHRWRCPSSPLVGGDSQFPEPGAFPPHLLFVR